MFKANRRLTALTRIENTLLLITCGSFSRHFLNLSVGAVFNLDVYSRTEKQ